MNRHERRDQVNSIAAVILALKVDHLRERGATVSDGDRTRLAATSLTDARRALNDVEAENP